MSPYILLVLSVSLAPADETLGTVRAAGGLEIAGALVSATCTPALAVTDERGNFTLSGLTPGCVLQIRADQFATASYTVAKPADPIEVFLSIDRLRQSVTVMDSSPLLAADPELSTAIDTRTLASLPSSTRDINRFAMLDPRVRNTGSLGTDGVYGTRLAVNGQLFRFTQYRMDGLSNYEPALGNGPQQVLPVSAVAEYKVLTNQFSAEYGRSTAGIISAITRTGGEQWRGRGFYIVRPSGIQAAPPVSTLRVPDQRQMWGGMAGGPLKSGFHLFAGVEGYRQTRGAFLQSPVPSFYVGHQNQWSGLVNADRQWSVQSIYVRLNAHVWVADNANDAVGGFNQPSTARRDSGQNTGLQATHRWIVKRTSVNELRFGISRSVPLSFYALHPQTQIVRPSYSTEGLSDFFDSRVLTWQGAEMFAWNGGGHGLRVGGDFIRNKLRDVSTTRFGSYRMPPGPPGPADAPLQYTQTFGAAPVRYGDTLASWFLQDDWRVRRSLTLNLGLRYDYQSTTGDGNNLAPRLGFAWALPGNGRTVLRGGAGLFYDQIFLQAVRGALQQGPGSRQATYTLPFGVVDFPRFPESLTAPPQGAGDRRDLAVLSEHRLNPYAAGFTLGIQRLLGRDWRLAANVAYTLSRKQLRVLDINAPARFQRTRPGQRRPALDADATRPYLTYAGVPVRTVGVFENTGSGRYSAVDVELSRRFARRFQMSGHYLNSSSVTYVFFTGGPNTGAPSDWRNPGIEERGPADFHQRHRVTAQAIVELPLGMQMSAFLVTASGLPVNPLTGVDNNGDGNLTDRPPGLGRNTYRTPFQNTIDLSVMKSLVIRTRLRAEIRVEGTNLLNRTNLLRLDAIYGDGARPLASFLQPVAGLANVDPARQLQIGIHFTLAPRAVGF